MDQGGPSGAGTAGAGPVDSVGTAVAGLGYRLLPAHDAAPTELLRFELDERDHFRRRIPDRGEAYYELAAVEESLRNARRWWAAGTDRLHVVTDDRGRLVARVNLVDIADGTAEVGYRVAPAMTGRGVASAGVTDLLATARRLDLRQVRASTSVENEASARVLERCGSPRPAVVASWCACRRPVGELAGHGPPAVFEPELLVPGTCARVAVPYQHAVVGPVGVLEQRGDWGERHMAHIAAARTRA